MEYPSHFLFQLRSWYQLQPYPCPVAEGQDQWNQSRLEFSQGCQVIGGETSDVITCAHFTQQAAAQKYRKNTQKEIGTDSKLVLDLQVSGS